MVGASGTFFDDWHYNASVTASEFKLRRIQSGYLIPQRIMDVVARGEFNFLNPEATPENIWDFISPDSDTVSTSNLWQANVTISRDLFALPGGNLAAAVGVVSSRRRRRTQREPATREMNWGAGSDPKSV